MLDKLFETFTNDFKEVPLFYVTFDLNHYKETGEKDSCTARIHPTLANDPFIDEQIKSVIDHIRNNYDMEDLCK